MEVWTIWRREKSLVPVGDSKHGQSCF